MEKVKGHVALVNFSDFGLCRGLYLAKALSLLGLDVTIIANKAIYNSSQRLSGDLRPDFNGKVIEFRIPFAKTLYSSILGRLIVYIIFTMFSFFEALRENPRPEILLSSQVNPFTEISCVMYKWFNRNVKIISDTTDLMPDGLEYIKMNHALKHMLIAIGHSINHSIYSKVNTIVTINDLMGKILQERFSRDVHVIYGAIDLDRFKPIDKKDALKVLPEEISSMVTSKFVVLYAGIMSPFQNPLVIVDIAERIQKEYPDIIFVMIGYGPLKQELKNIVSQKSLRNILILDPVAHELMPFIYNIADLTLLPPPVLSISGMYEYFELAMTRKFIEYAACGKPILCITPPCVASELCLKWKAGNHVLPQNIEEAVVIIKILKESEELKEHMSKNARRLAEDLFSIDYAAKTLSKIVGTDTTNHMQDAPFIEIENQKINVR